MTKAGQTESVSERMLEIRVGNRERSTLWEMPMSGNEGHLADYRRADKNFVLATCWAENTARAMQKFMRQSLCVKFMRQTGPVL
jgi:hypothetical protein